MTDLVAPASPLLQTLRSAKERQEALRDVEECRDSLITFIERGWHVVKPEIPFKNNWHIEAVCDKLQAITRGEVKRQQIWLPPVMMKSLAVSVFWPAWEWTIMPGMRYWGASYEVRFAARLAALSRDFMMDDWWTDRWGDNFHWVRESEFYFMNSRGGTRLATAPESTGTGEHGNRILIDDPISAQDADATSKSVLRATNQWYDNTVVTRGVDDDHARVIIMQRLHEEDLAAHVLDLEDWEVLCLPERYERSHPFVWPDDPRTEEGQLLWPEQRGEEASNALAKSLRSRASGQLQQRPSPKEGDILQRSWWRFYDPRIRTQERWEQRFSRVVISVDCPQKDKQSNDNVAIQCWAVFGADRYLLDLRLGKMNYNLAKRQIIEMARWSRKRFPSTSHFLLIENTGYGPEMIIDLKLAGFTGVTKISPQQEGDKVVRAESAADALESGNCFLPGHGLPWQPAYDESKTPEDITDLIENFAKFPNAAHDDDVDAWSQCMNWLRGKSGQPMRTGSAHKRRRPTPSR